MSRWREELSRVEWSALRVSHGQATSVPEALIRLAESPTIEEGWKAYWELDNSIVVQGNLFSAAEHVVPFSLELAIDREDHVRTLSLELLIQIAGGTTHYSELEFGNDRLHLRCHKAVTKGIAYFYALLESPSEEVRDRAVELIGLTEDDSARKTWTMKWVDANDPSDKTRDLAGRIAREDF